MTGRKTAVATAAAALASALLVTGPANADQADQADQRRTAVTKATVSTKYESHPDRATAGYAEMRITITWKSKKKAVVRGWLKDRCPGDGNAVQIRLYNQKVRKLTVNDERGCHARGRVHYAGTITAPRGAKKLPYVYLNLFEFTSSNYAVDYEHREFRNKLL